MGLISGIVTLPLAPVRMVLWLGEVVSEQVVAQTRDPAALRRQVEEIDEKAESGELSGDQARAAQRRVLRRAVGRRGEAE